MRKVLASTLLVLFLTGCAGTAGPYLGGAPAGGWVYTSVTAPSVKLHAPLDLGVKSNKVGTAEAISILGMVGVGDAGIDAAMKNGGITKVHHVDNKVMSFLGIYAKWTVVVYGE